MQPASRLTAEIMLKQPGALETKTKSLPWNLNFVFELRNRLHWFFLCVYFMKQEPASKHNLSESTEVVAWQILYLLLRHLRK